MLTLAGIRTNLWVQPAQAFWQLAFQRSFFPPDAHTECCRLLWCVTQGEKKMYFFCSKLARDHAPMVSNTGCATHVGEREWERCIEFPLLTSPTHKATRVQRLLARSRACLSNAGPCSGHCCPLFSFLTGRQQEVIPPSGPTSRVKRGYTQDKKICSAYILETAKRRLLHIHSDIKVYEVLPTPTSAPHTPLTARTTQEASNMWQRPPRTTQEASKFDPSLAHSHFSRTPSTV